MSTCWFNRTLIVSLVPYVAEDTECDDLVDHVVIVPTFEVCREIPPHWVVFTCARHLNALVKDLTDPDDYGMDVADLIVTSVISREVDQLAGATR